MVPLTWCGTMLCVIDFEILNPTYISHYLSIKNVAHKLDLNLLQDVYVSGWYQLKIRILK